MRYLYIYKKKSRVMEENGHLVVHAGRVKRTICTRGYGTNSEFDQFM